MMTRIITETINCPNCHHSSKVELYDSINVTLDPELKTKLLKHTIFDWRCPHCQQQYTMPYGFLYHDMEKKLLIHFFQNEETLQETLQSHLKEETILQHFLNAGYQVRYVADYEELIEKISLFEEGFDDRGIEVVKAIIRRSAEEQEIERIIFSNQQAYGTGLYLLQDEKILNVIPIEENIADIYQDIQTVIDDNEPIKSYLVDGYWANWFLESIENK